MTVIKCDMCGKSIEGLGDRHMLKCTTVNTTTMDIVMDVCQDCAKSIENFVRKEQHINGGKDENS